MDLTDHIELTHENAKVLFNVFIDWFEDCESGFDEGIYDEEPDEDDRIAYQHATAFIREPIDETVRLPWHAAVAVEAGVQSHLENIEGGLSEGIFTDPAPEGASAALADLSAKLAVLDRTPSFA